MASILDNAGSGGGNGGQSHRTTRATGAGDLELSNPVGTRRNGASNATNDVDGLNGLPRDWYEGFDAVHSRFYYFHKPTRRSTWTRPDFEAAGIGAGGAGEGSATPATAAAATEEGLDRDVSALSLNTSTASSTNAPASSAPKTTTALSGDWLEVFSAEHNRVFYYNRVTRESVWTDPRLLMPSPRPNHQSPSQHQTAKVVMTAGPTTAMPSGSSSSSATASSPATRPLRAMGGGDAGINRLQESLDEYTRELQRSSQAVLEKTKQYSNDYSRATFDEVNELAATAEALLGKAEGATTGVKRPRSDPNTSLVSWGNEPVKEIEIKKVVKSAANGLEYVKSEIKAQKEAKEEATVVDVEGGYYQILGVPTDADAEMMKKAYRKGMIRWHPDKVAETERNDATEKSNLLQNAYNCLSDPWQRYLYDWFGLKRYLVHKKVVECFKNYLLTGIEIHKHPSSKHAVVVKRRSFKSGILQSISDSWSEVAGGPQKRMFWISPDGTSFHCGKQRILEPTPEEKKFIKDMRVRDILEIRKGITTETFQRTGIPSLSSRYFSIVMANKTFDFEAESKERCDFLVTRLSLLVMDTQQNRKWIERYYEIDALVKAAKSMIGSPSGATNVNSNTTSNPSNANSAPSKSFTTSKASSGSPSQSKRRPEEDDGLDEADARV